MLERIDHIVAVVPDLSAAASSYERLGLVLTPETHHEETGVSNRACFVGESAGSYSYLELLSIDNEARAAATGRQHYIDAARAGGGVVSIAFGVADAAAAASQFTARGYPAEPRIIHREDGSVVCEVAAIDTRGALPYHVSVISYPESWQQRFERSRAAGRFAHRFPLHRLDHLAAMVPDLEAATSFWTGVLDVPVHGEIRTPQLIIRQMKVGDAIFELLGPATPESPLANRPPGIASMCAWEVLALDEAASLARERGFAVSEPEPGVIPGTRRATIAGPELGNVAMQLLEYVAP